MYITIAFLIFILVAVILFLHRPQFGKLPAGERLEIIKRSANYKNGAFLNQSITPDLTEGASYFSVIREFTFGKSKRVRPVDRIPSVKTDLLNLDIQKDVLIWFGHSSYFIQIDGKRILVDPVFSGSATPLPFGTKAFKGADIYTAKKLFKNGST